MKDFEKKVKGYALKNAISHEGKASPGPVISAMFNEGLKKEDMKKYGKEISKIISEINSFSLEEQKKKFEKIKAVLSKREIREGLPELPNISKKGVVMRIAPSASGPMHVMHGIVASLSYDYVKKYGGKMIMRIEDTNPENIYPDAYKLLKKDAEFLFEKKAEVVIQSDRMNLYYDYAKKLIKKDVAYVCTCSSEDFKKLVDSKKPCGCRKLSVKENLERWEKMFNEFKQGEAVLRFKSDIKHKNPAMRDFPLARINETAHPRQKNKFRVWPLMNLAVAVDDIEMKMTHIIRGKDHRDNSERQKLIFECLGKKYPWCGFLGRYHFKGLELSTSKFRKEIEEGKYSGWDDVKLPTISSLKKRGYKAFAFWKMAEHIGISETDKNYGQKDFFDLLDKFNKEQ